MSGDTEATTKPMDILLLSGDITTQDVEVALLTEGIVVLETTRVEARNIARQVRKRLFPDGYHEGSEDDEKPRVLVHLSAEVHFTAGGHPELTWTDYLVYTKSFKQGLDRAEHFVRQAVVAWLADGGTRDRFVHQVR